jgi:hypothetical protein
MAVKYSASLFVDQLGIDLALVGELEALRVMYCVRGDALIHAR